MSDLSFIETFVFGLCFGTIGMIIGYAYGYFFGRRGAAGKGFRY